MRQRAEKAEAELAQLKAPSPVMGKTAPDPCDARDPQTGWTFATFNEQFDMNRAAVRVLVAELALARQQIAGTKGVAQ